MGIDTIPLDEQRRRRLAMEEYVDSIERAQNNPFLPAFEASPLVQALNRLKSFFSFITSLTNSKYWQWMEKAFSSYKHTESTPASIKITPDAQPTNPYDIEIAFEAPAPERKRKKFKLF